MRAFIAAAPAAGRPLSHTFPRARARGVRTPPDPFVAGNPGTSENMDRQIQWTLSSLGNRGTYTRGSLLQLLWQICHCYRDVSDLPCRDICDSENVRNNFLP